MLYIPNKFRFGNVTGDGPPNEFMSADFRYFNEYVLQLMELNSIDYFGVCCYAVAHHWTTTHIRYRIE